MSSNNNYTIINLNKTIVEYHNHNPYIFCVLDQVFVAISIQLPTSFCNGAESINECRRNKNGGSVRATAVKWASVWQYSSMPTSSYAAANLNKCLYCELLR